MVSRHTTTWALMISLLAAPLAGAAHAAELGGPPTDSSPALPWSYPSALSRFVSPAALDGIERWRDPVNPFAVKARAEEQRGYGYGYRRGRSRRAAATALMIGATATITGTALLVYANRPECSTNVLANGCGYGAKVLGTSVLAGGVVGVAIGAALW